MQSSLSFNALFSQLDLLWAWTLRTVRARYQQSVLGALWAIVQPVASVAIFTVIFTMFIPIDTGSIPYVVFSYSAMVPWLFFAASVTDMVESLIVNMSLVSKIYFPREILPIAAMLARLLDFAIAYGVLFILLLYFGLPIFTPAWIFLPAILLIQFSLVLGIGLIGSAINVFFRDIKHLFTLGLQLWMYATPIIYPVTAVPESVRPYYFLNPMAGIVEAYRAVLLYGQTPAPSLWLSAGVALLALVGGYWFFKRVEFQFADVI
jgi:lipopolysaccharide transport system permease protein